ncbi:MAG: hypothetical protein HY924_12765 [Elusimicrobia bacterium]|nr:hypothetical protein [Elusimicrobiota bacterium]
MELYLNETLIHADPAEDEVRAAFERLRGGGEGSLVLVAGARSSLEVFRGEEGAFGVTLEKGRAQYGVFLHEDLSGRAVEAMVEYLRGGTPMLVDPRLYAYDADCPLCAAMAAAEARG